MGLTTRHTDRRRRAAEQGTIPAAELRALLAAVTRGQHWRAALDRLDLPVVARKRSWFTNLRKAALYCELPTAAAHRALDLGAGSGVIAAGLAAKYARVVALEQEGDWCAFMRRRFAQDGLPQITVLQANCLDLPLRDESFDLICVNGVLEWVPDASAEGHPSDVQLRFLGSLHRSLRPGGALGVAIENRWFFEHFLGSAPHGEPAFAPVLPRRLANWLTRHLQGKDYRNWIYGWRAYGRLLRQAGFREVSVRQVLPTYHDPQRTAELRDSRATAAFLDGSRRLAPLLNMLARLGVLGFLTHSFYIAARK